MVSMPNRPEYATPRLLARFWSKVDRTDSCWQWTASLASGGYGQFFVPQQGPRRAHRVAYEILVGPIPEGLQLDHLCRNRACVNPAHLEPVTNRENTVRGIGPQLTRERQLALTHCKYGHPLAGDDVRVDDSGHRHCRACQRRKARESAGLGQAQRARGPMRAIVERITSRRYRLECGHVVDRACGRKFATAQCEHCEPPSGGEVAG